MDDNLKSKNKERMLFQKKTNTLYFLFGLVFTGFVSLRIAEIPFLNEFYYNLSEMLHGYFFLCIIFFPFAFFTYLYFQIKYTLTNKEKPSSWVTLRHVLLICLTIFFVKETFYELNGGIAEGYYTIENHNKLYENDKYYLFLEGKKVEVSVDTFNQMELNNQYRIKYKWNKLSPDRGEFIEFGQ